MPCWIRERYPPILHSFILAFQTKLFARLPTNPVRLASIALTKRRPRTFVAGGIDREEILCRLEWWSLRLRIGFCPFPPKARTAKWRHHRDGPSVWTGHGTACWPKGMLDRSLFFQLLHDPKMNKIEAFFSNHGWLIDCIVGIYRSASSL